MGSKKLEIICPCCETKLQVDNKTGDVNGLENFREKSGVNKLGPDPQGPGAPKVRMHWVSISVL